MITAAGGGTTTLEGSEGGTGVGVALGAGAGVWVLDVFSVFPQNVSE